MKHAGGQSTERIHFRLGRKYRNASRHVLALITLLLFASGGRAQEGAKTYPAFPDFEHLYSTNEQTSQGTSQSSQSTSTTGTQGQQSPAQKPEGQATPAPNPQPQRILGIMPNFRAVSAGVIPPPPTPRQAFIIATQNSFDYSSFIFVGITSLLSEAADDHSQLGKGVPGFGRYYWRGFADKTIGNYMVIFALPTVIHQDERYYSKGTGGFWKRMFYSASRVIITPNYHGHPSFNASELFGRGIAQAISLTYYPSQTRTFGGIASKYGYAIGRDALTNAFREFWPDIAVHVLHRHP
jgi:hypothetical protein